MADGRVCLAKRSPGFLPLRHAIRYGPVLDQVIAAIFSRILLCVRMLPLQ